MNNQYAIKGVLFDKDGTLIDFDKTWFPINLEIATYFADGDMEKVGAMFEATGASLTEKRHYPNGILGAGTARDITKVWAGILGRDDLCQMEQYYNVCSAKLLGQNITEITDTQALFKQLQTMGISVGIATMDSVNNLNTFMQHIGLDNDKTIFRVGYDSGFGVKPESGMVDAFANFCNIKNSKILMVGDNNHDIDMGLNANCRASVGVLSGNCSAGDMPNANIIISDVSKIPQLIAQQYCL